MNIEQLRRDLFSVQKELPTIKFSNLENGAAAVVYPDGNIIISTTLNKNERVEAEAHELLHILLNKLGLLQIAAKFEGEFEFLALEINNALSHWILIDQLKNDYNIESELHLNERTASLCTMRSLIEKLYFDHNITLMKGLGVRLYDIARTIPEKGREIIDIASSNQVVNDVFQKASTILSRITIDLSKEMQLKYIREFLFEIGENPSYFSYR